MLHEICLDCCKYGRKECPGKEVTEDFTEMLDNQVPTCYRECPDECPFDGDCPSLVDYPPEDAEEAF